MTGRRRRLAHNWPAGRRRRAREEIVLAIPPSALAQLRADVRARHLAAGNAWMARQADEIAFKILAGGLPA